MSFTWLKSWTPMLALAALITCWGSSFAQETKVPAPANSEVATATATFRKLTTHEYPVVSVAFSLDGKKLASVTGSFSFVGVEARICDVKTGKLLFTLPGSYRKVAFSPDGKMLATMSDPGIVSFYDTSNGRKLRTLTGGNTPVLDLAFLPDSEILITGDAANYEEPPGIIRFWDTNTGRQKSQVVANKYSVRALAYSSNGKLIASLGANQSATIWNASTGTRACSIADHQNGCQVSFAPNRYLLATADRNGAHLWDASSGAEHVCIPEIVNCLAFSGDGRIVATASNENSFGPLPRRDGVKVVRKSAKTVCFWEVASGREIFRLSPPAHNIHSVAISSDGQYVATGGDDAGKGTVFVWDLPSQYKLAVGQLSKVEDLADVAKCWRDLSSEEPIIAYRAIEALTQSKVDVVSYAKKELVDVFKQQARIRQLITDLDNNAFRTRDSATNELRKLARTAEPALRLAKTRQPSAEVTQRIDDILGKLPERTPMKPELPLTSEQLFLTRTIQLLEKLGTHKDAREILESIEVNAITAWDRHEAAAALERLANRQNALAQ